MIQRTCGIKITACTLTIRLYLFTTNKIVLKNN